MCLWEGEALVGSGCACCLFKLHSTGEEEQMPAARAERRKICLPGWATRKAKPISIRVMEGWGRHTLRGATIKLFSGGGWWGEGQGPACLPAGDSPSLPLCLPFYNPQPACLSDGACLLPLGRARWNGLHLEMGTLLCYYLCLPGEGIE